MLDLQKYQDNCTVTKDIHLNSFTSHHWSYGYLLISLPPSHSLVIKDHPHSMAGNMDESMVNLVKSADNSFYIDPSISTFEVIENADIVISVASTSVIEALIKWMRWG